MNNMMIIILLIIIKIINIFFKMIYFILSMNQIHQYMKLRIKIINIKLKKKISKKHY